MCIGITSTCLGATQSMQGSKALLGFVSNLTACPEGGLRANSHDVLSHH